MAAAASLHFQKFEILMIGSPVRGQNAPPCQVSSKSVKQLHRYGDLTTFKNFGRTPAWIFEIQIFNGRGS